VQPSQGHRQGRAYPSRAKPCKAKGRDGNARPEGSQDAERDESGAGAGLSRAGAGAGPGVDPRRLGAKLLVSPCSALCSSGFSGVSERVRPPPARACRNGGWVVDDGTGRPRIGA
jgi:hypothetical protein